jgi:predicted acyl esterase
MQTPRRTAAPPDPIFWSREHAAIRLCRQVRKPGSGIVTKLVAGARRFDMFPEHDGVRGGSSMAEYSMKVDKGVTVTMRDGVRISLCVYRPDAPGQFPALFAASPYQYEMDEVPAYPLSNGTSARATPMSTPTCAAPASPRASSSSWD